VTCLWWYWYYFD